MAEESKRWIELAKEDLGVARHLNKTYYPKPLEIICYHCQQAGEKAVKAVIAEVDSDKGIPKSHDISFLLVQIKNRVDIDEENYDCADRLTPYGVTIRYPHELNLTEDNVTKAIEAAEKLLEFASKCTD